MPNADAARVLVRTTCGERIGLGHLRRCQTLGEALVSDGADVRYRVVGDERARELVAALNAPAELVSSNADEPQATVQAMAACNAELLVVDDYAISSETLRAFRGSSVLVAVLDDLADRELPVDLIVNGAVGAAERGYVGATGRGMLLGPSYALLRPEIRELTQTMRRADASVSRVLVTLGGSDPRGLTSAVAALVRQTLPSVAVDVVIGPLAKPPKLDDAAVQIHVTPPNLLRLMRGADLAVSAAGQTLYELAALGTPTIALEVADNQRPQLAALSAAGVVVAATMESLGAALRALANDHARRVSMARRGQALIDGSGATRVAEAILELISLRRSSHG